MGRTAALDFEFDHVFTVHEDGTVSDAPQLYAPSVWHSETDDVEIDGTGWTPLTGYTGQYGYNGAVMHASEQFAGGIARDVLSTPGTYVLVVVSVWPDGRDDDPEPAGWAVLRHDDCPVCGEHPHHILCGGYEYQSCEHPEWRTSEALRFCEAFRHALCMFLSRGSDCWSISDADVTA